jgi:hypothetical protein
MAKKKHTSLNAQDINVTDIQKHTVQNHMHVLKNVEETITQPHVQNHQTHRPNVHCAEEIILQVKKDAKCTRTCKKTEASQSTKLLIDPSSKKSMLTIETNSHLSTQTKLKINAFRSTNFKLTSAQSKSAITSYSKSIFNISEFKTMFN